MLRASGRKVTGGQESMKELICAHCGDPCTKDSISEDGNYFCCSGCLTVFNLLGDKNLDSYYNIESNPGLKPDLTKSLDQYLYLDKDSVSEKLLSFNDGKTARISLNIPQIHCSSCIWLLENLFNFSSGYITCHFLVISETALIDNYYSVAYT